MAIRLTCLQRRASRTRQRLPWWCGSYHLETDHWGKWPSAQPAYGWRSETVWWGCACRYKHTEKKENKISQLHYPLGLTVKCTVHYCTAEYHSSLWILQRKILDFLSSLSKTLECQFPQWSDTLVKPTNRGAIRCTVNFSFACSKITRYINRSVQWHLNSSSINVQAHVTMPCS